MPTPTELLDQVLDEARGYESWDSEMRSNPYSPWRRAEELLAVPELVPFLADVVRENGPGARWAVHALAIMGPAARAASAAVEQRGESVALFAIDEPRARALGLHRDARRDADGKTARSMIARHVLQSHDVDRVRSHYADLLRDGAPITDLRLEWLAQLGVADSLLQPLAARPTAVVSGARSIVANGSNKAADAALCVRAEAAGVPSVAALYTTDVAERGRLRAAATAHVDHVRVGCRA